ncbi:MAG TPA: HAMP domain-containing protein, partial [Phycisphaerae bacterium]|nr:HAMP domain-containing protein [Phycisphaerae bacterium]
MTRPGRFFWKLFLGNAVLMAVVLGTSVWIIVREVEEAYRENLTQRLLAQAVTIRHEVRDTFGVDRRQQLQKTAQEIGAIEEADIRVTMVAANGTVLADSQAAPETMENHADRPEIAQAMREGVGHAERGSATVKRDMKYVAVRVSGPDGQTLGTIRVAMPIPGIAAQTATMSRLIWQTAAIGLAAAIVLALGLAYVWSNPIRRITETARSLSRGDLSARTRVSGGDEIAQMGASLNQMRDSIATQLQTIDQQRRNLEYLIRSLTEGVIVAGPDGRILLMNAAACRLLGTFPGQPEAARLAGESSLDLDEFVGRR